MNSFICLQVTPYPINLSVSMAAFSILIGRIDSTVLSFQSLVFKLD